MNQGVLQAVLRTGYKQKTVMYKGGKTAASAIQQRFVIDELLLAILFSLCCCRLTSLSISLFSKEKLLISPFLLFVSCFSVFAALLDLVYWRYLFSLPLIYFKGLLFCDLCEAKIEKKKHPLFFLPGDQLRELGCAQPGGIKQI